MESKSEIVNEFDYDSELRRDEDPLEYVLRWATHWSNECFGDRKLAWESLAIDINHLIKKYDLMFENINDHENS